MEATNNNIDIEKVMDTLQEWVRTQEHLPQCLERQVLLKFYYSSECDLERAKKLIDGNYTMRNLYSHIFLDRDPCSEAMDRVLDNTDYLTLPGVTPCGSKLFLYRLRSGDPAKFEYTEAVKGFFMFADVRITMPDPIGLAGREIAIFDMSGYSVRHILRTPMSTVKIYSRFTQEVHCIRVKQLHVLNFPSVLERFMKLIRPFIKNDVFKVMVFHTPGNDTLDKYIPRDMLPEEYGGKAGKVDDLKKYWVDVLRSKRDYIMNAKYWKVDESKRKQPSDIKKDDEEPLPSISSTEISNSNGEGFLFD